jgi:hypothetical protein
MHPVHLGPPEPALEAAFRSRYGAELLCIPQQRNAAAIRRIVRGLRKGHADRIVLVVIPEKVEAVPHPHALDRARAGRLFRGLSRERGVAVAIVPTMSKDDSLLSRRTDHLAIVVVEGTDVVAERAMAVGRLVSKHEPRFIHFDVDDDETEQLERAWERDEPGVPLEIEPAPIRELADAMVTVIRRTERAPDTFVTVVRGEVVPPWWLRFLHVDESREAKAALIREPGTALILVPYPLAR